MEVEELEKRLFSNLLKAFEQDTNIDEFDFLPVVDADENKNPIILVDHKLGIEIWAMKMIYSASYDKLMHSLLDGAKYVGDHENSMKNLTTVVLMLNADTMTAWNCRKTCVQNEQLSIAEDLKFNELILRKHPKSPETFCHRKWLLTRLASFSDGVVQRELSVCGRASERYANNYNSWSHRVWVMDTVVKWQRQWVQTELDKTKAFLKTHVSDHSGLHYRQVLLQHLDSSDVVLEELDVMEEFIGRYPGHEALWYHRRALINQVLNHQEALDKFCSRKAASSEECSEHKKVKLSKIDQLMAQERRFCERLVEGVGVEATWQKVLSENYKQWLAQRTGVKR